MMKSHNSSSNKKSEQNRRDSSHSNDSENVKDFFDRKCHFKQLKNFIAIPKNFRSDFKQHASDRIALSQKFLSICLLGVTGHGKSSTANTLCGTENNSNGKEFFKISEGTESETDFVNGLVTTWQGDPMKEAIILLDTPGFGDTKGLDTSNIANIVCQLKLLGYVHTFMLIFNSEDPRFDEQLQSTLKIFSQMFGQKYFKNVLICFTKFATDKRTESARQRGKKPTKEKLIEDYMAWFNKIYSYSLKVNQFIFLNNGVEKDQAVEDIELEEQMNALTRIREFTERRSKKPFYCKDIKEVMKEKDALQRKILRMSEEAEKERKNYIEEHEKKLKETIEKERAEAEKREKLFKEKAAHKEEENRKKAAEREEQLELKMVKKEKKLRKEAALREQRIEEESRKEIERIKRENEAKEINSRRDMEQRINQMQMMMLMNLNQRNRNRSDSSSDDDEPNMIFLPGSSTPLIRTGKHTWQ